MLFPKHKLIKKHGFDQVWSESLPMNSEGLEELRPLADGLRMLDDDPDSPGAGAVRDLDPVPANAEKM